MSFPRLAPIASIFCLLGACGGDDSGASGSGGSAQGGSAQGGSAQGGSAQGGSAQGGSGGSGGANGGAGGGGATPGTWTTLVEGDWNIESGSEIYTCVLATIPEDIYIAGFRAVAPLGTHHTVLTRETGGQDRTFDCDVSTNGPNMIYGSGVGTDVLEFPAGVAVKLEAGEKVLLNLHLFNVSPNAITGTSGIEVLRVDPGDVEFEAEMVLAGKDQGLFVDTGETTERGQCTMNEPATVFAVIPHMHQLGTHMRVQADVGGDLVPLIDAPYSFDDQQYIVQDPPVALGAGDKLLIDCTYRNMTGSAVSFGDSSLAEMCYAGTYRYPKQGTNGITCTD